MSDRKPIYFYVKCLKCGSEDVELTAGMDEREVVWGMLHCNECGKLDDGMPDEDM